MTTQEDARGFALALPYTTEAPHFEKASFWVEGKVFATLPADGEHLHVFVDEEETRAATAEHPAACEELWWGRRLSGVRVTLSAADQALVQELLPEARRCKALRCLALSVEGTKGTPNEL